MYTNLIYIYMYTRNHGGYPHTHTYTHIHIHTSLIDDQGRDFRFFFYLHSPAKSCNRRPDRATISETDPKYKIRRSSKRTVVIGRLLRSTLPHVPFSMAPSLGRHYTLDQRGVDPRSILSMEAAVQACTFRSTTRKSARVTYSNFD